MFVLNFQPGLSWEEVKKVVIKDDDDNCTDVEPVGLEVTDEDAAWTDWQEEESSHFALRCLFCNCTSAQVRLYVPLPPKKN